MSQSTHLTLHEERGLFTKFYNALSGKDGNYWEGVFNKVLRKENPFPHNYHVQSFISLIDSIGGTDGKISEEVYEKNKIILTDVIDGVKAWTETFRGHPDYPQYNECWIKFKQAKMKFEICDAIEFLYTTGKWR